MTTLSQVTAVVPRAGKIIKNGLSVFERGEICYLYNRFGGE